MNHSSIILKVPLYLNSFLSATHSSHGTSAESAWTIAAEELPAMITLSIEKQKTFVKPGKSFSHGERKLF